jgi:tetratricopeptide (TPR) repeat protein
VEQVPLKHRSKRGQWPFRFAAMGLVCLPLLVGEIMLNLIDPSWARLEEDPLVGFSEIKSLFELNQQTDHYQIRKDRLRAFVQNGFTASKQPNTYRIFCLGGSTVQGRPYSIETSFTTWMRLSLETTHPDLNVEVINCGGVSYASYRLVPILKECLQYDPDLILLCTGNNEFLEDRSYTYTKKSLPVLEPALQILSKSAVVRSALTLGTKWAHFKTPRGMLGPEVDAMLDYERGIERYHRNETWWQSVEAHFQVNVQSMIRTCQKANIPMLLLSPCVNLKDSPPFKSQHQTNFDSSKLIDWENKLTAASTEIENGNMTEALNLLKAALQLDFRHAMVWYKTGHLLYQTGKFQEAKLCFEKALEEDICPLRIRSDMRTTLMTLAELHHVPFHDLQHTARLSTPTGITGSEFLVDHVHPTIKGHQSIGIELARVIQNLWLNKEATGDQSDRIKHRFQDHLDSLPDHYYVNGLQRLQNLKAWTQGRADGSPIESLPKPEHGL